MLMAFDALSAAMDAEKKYEVYPLSYGNDISQGGLLHLLIIPASDAHGLAKCTTSSMPEDQALWPDRTLSAHLHVTEGRSLISALALEPKLCDLGRSYSGMLLETDSSTQ